MMHVVLMYVCIFFSMKFVSCKHTTFSKTTLYLELLHKEITQLELTIDLLSGSTVCGCSQQTLQQPEHGNFNCVCASYNKRQSTRTPQL